MRSGISQPTKEQGKRHTELRVGISSVGVDGILNLISVALHRDGLTLIALARNVGILLELAGGGFVEAGRHDVFNVGLSWCKSL